MAERTFLVKAATEAHHGKSHIVNDTVIATNHIEGLKQVVDTFENPRGPLYSALIADAAIGEKDPNRALYLSERAVRDMIAGAHKTKSEAELGGLVIQVDSRYFGGNGRIEVLREGRWVPVEEYRFDRWVPLESIVEAHI